MDDLSSASRQILIANIRLNYMANVPNIFVHDTHTHTHALFKLDEKKSPEKRN